MGDVVFRSVAPIEIVGDRQQSAVGAECLAVQAKRRRQLDGPDQRRSDRGPAGLELAARDWLPREGAAKATDAGPTVETKPRPGASRRDVLVVS